MNSPFNPLRALIQKQIFYRGGPGQLVVPYEKIRNRWTFDSVEFWRIMHAGYGNHERTFVFRSDIALKTCFSSKDCVRSSLYANAHESILLQESIILQSLRENI